MNVQAWEVLEQYRMLPFIWGESDCFLFACHIQDALYGTDSYLEHKGKYHSKRSAITYFAHQTNTRSFTEAIQTIWKPSPPLRGCIALKGTACGIYLGQTSTFRHSKGLTILPSSSADTFLKPKNPCKTL